MEVRKDNSRWTWIFLATMFVMGVSAIIATIINPKLSFLIPLVLLFSLIARIGLRFYVHILDQEYIFQLKKNRYYGKNRPSEEFEAVVVACSKCNTIQKVRGYRPFVAKCRKCEFPLVIPKKKKLSKKGPTSEERHTIHSKHFTSIIKMGCPQCRNQQIIACDRTIDSETSCKGCGVTFFIPKRNFDPEFDYDEPVKIPPPGVETLIVTSIGKGPSGENSVSINCPKCQYMQVAILKKPFVVKCEHCGSWLELPGIH